MTQVLACGFTRAEMRTRLGTGRWERVLPRVFRMRGAPQTWRQLLMAAVLWAGEQAAVSHRAAARLWSLDGFAAGVVEISTRRRIRGQAPNVRVRTVRRLMREEVAVIDGIPVTSVARTLIDISGCASRRLAERALDDALRRRLVKIPELWNYLRMEGRQGRNGAGALRALLEDRDGSYRPPDSVLSRKLERIILASSLPRPERQYPIFDNGALRRVFDLCYPEAKLAIEADGYTPHSGRIPWSKDQTKDNAMAVLGWVTLRYTKYDMDDRPAELIEEIRLVLEERLKILRP